MNAALLVLLASGVGVDFGWRPMPDGSPSYEYIVQLEPELLATLEEGQSVPIASEVPEDVRPIGRIRIVVGREPLPRQKLVTRFKPWPEQTGRRQSRQAIVETQYTAPPVEPGRLGALGSPQPQLPPFAAVPPQRVNSDAAARNPPIHSNQPTPGESFAQVLRQSAQQARELTQNAGQSVRADAQQLFGDNALGQEPLRRAGQAVERVGDHVHRGLQQGVQPLREAVEQTGQQLRGAVQGIGQRTREAVDQLGRPFGERSILGPPKNFAQADNHSAPAFDNRGPLSEQNPQSNLPRMQRLDEPVSPDQIGRWKQPGHWDRNTPTADSLRVNTDPPRVNSDATDRFPVDIHDQRPVDGRELRQQPRYNDPALADNQEYRSGQPDRYGSPPLLAPANPTSWPHDSGRGSLDMANRQPQGQAQDAAADAWANGPRLPSQPSQPVGPFITRNPLDTANRPPPPATPEIRRNMLAQPADADIHGASGQPAFATTEAAKQTADQPAKKPGGVPPQATDYGWDTAQLPANSPVTSANNRPSTPSTGGSAFPLILAWVLLSGSGAGNLYLFWSYLDVRNKYRSLVRGAARKMTGDRFVEEVEEEE